MPDSRFTRKERDRLVRAYWDARRESFADETGEDDRYLALLDEYR